MKYAHKPWYKKWWGIFLIILAIFFVSLLFAFAIFIVNYIKNVDTASVPRKYISNPVIEGAKNNYWLGSANPKITIVEFSDFNCVYCQKSFSKIREITSVYNNIKFIYRDFPVLSDFSIQLALAARCAGEQGLFWIMHDKLFLNQGLGSDEKIFEAFKQIGGNEKKFNACFANKKYLPDIEKDLIDGQKLNISGTPAWFINGQRIEGDIPYEFLINLIKQNLK
ncbi:thioredoxin domain-containing protein [Candidatus Parcubacteria bacterium]|nr:thioredoxin domain-containing protein [Candidatus Parcubacteria bacterium]